MFKLVGLMAVILIFSGLTPMALYLKDYMKADPMQVGYYIVGYEGLELSFYGVKCDTFRIVSNEGKIDWSVLETDVNHLYTMTSTDPNVWISDGDKLYREIGGGWIKNDWEGGEGKLPATKEFIGGGMDLDPDASSYGMANFRGRLDQPKIKPIMDRWKGILQDLDTPYDTFTWEILLPDNIHKKVFVIHLWILETTVDIGIYPSYDWEHDCAYDGGIIWLRVIPRDWTYFRVNPEEPKPNVVFGLAAMEVEDTITLKKILPDWVRDWTGGWEGGQVGWKRGDDLAIFLSPELGAPIPPEFPWENLRVYENVYLNPVIFKQEGWYIPMLFSKLICDRQNIGWLPDWLGGGYKVMGDLISTKLNIHAFVIGEWKVKKEYHVEWERWEPFHKWIGDIFTGLWEFIKSPLGILSLLALLAGLLGFISLIGVGKCCMMVSALPLAGGCCMGLASILGLRGKKVEKRYYYRMLDNIRHMRDNYLKPYRLGRIIIFLYYYIVSPPICLLMKIPLLGGVIAWGIRNLFIKPVNWISVMLINNK